MAADVGTGSGCIAIALACNIPDLQMLAVDASYRALKIAAENALQHAVSDRVSLVNCDLLTPVRKRFDLVCANLPYIPKVDLKSLAVARREPIDALDGGPDGLDLIRRLMNAVPRLLSPDGLLLLEIAADQGNTACEIAKSTLPRSDIQMLKDLAGRDRLLRVRFRDG
jgi:release factor glutamine methyltransferase